MVYKKFEINKALVGIWKITQTREELLALAGSDAFLLKALAGVRSEKRQTEKLATFLLLREMLGAGFEMEYSPSGKPSLANHKLHVSISHTAGYVAVVLSPQTVGIDIQRIEPKIVRLRSRFVTPREVIDPTREIVHLMLHWSAKEAMFKQMDRQAVDLLAHLHIRPFKPENHGFFEVYETKTDDCRQMKAYYEVEPDFVLVVTQ